MTDILELAEQGRADELYELLRARAQRSLYEFARAVMFYKEMTPRFHLPICQFVQDSASKKRGVLAPRAHFKSSIGKAYSLWCMTQNPDTRILYVGESDAVAQKNLRDIKGKIEGNQVLAWLFPELVPQDLNKTTWTNSEILLPRPGSFDEVSIMTAGVGAKMTGFHFDLIIYDDIIGEKAAYSEAEMKRAIEWVQYAPGLLHDPDESQELYIGTRWKHGSADLYGWLMENVPQIRWYIRSAVEEGQPVFPERFTLEKLDEIRKRMGDYKFYCQYMNDPTPPEGADFPPHWFREYDVSQDGRTILPLDGSPAVALGQLLRMSFYDVSAGGKSATAENAIVVAGMDSRKRLFVLDDWAANCSIGDAVEQWLKLNDQFVCYRNHYEQVGAQKAIEDVLRERKLQTSCARCSTPEKQRSHRRLEPTPVKPPGGSVNKEDRIRMFAQAICQEGRVYFRRGRALQLRRQLFGFPHISPIDRADAFAYLCNLLRAPVSDDEIKEEKQRADAFLAQRKPRTHTSVDYGGYA